MLQYCNNINNKNTGNEKYKTKIRIKQATDIRKKKNREKNFSFRRFFLFLRFSVGRGGVAMSFRAEVRRTGVEESASVNRPLDCRSS